MYVVTINVFPEICWNFSFDAYFRSNYPITNANSNKNEYKNKWNVNDLDKIDGSITDI